jgi:hypothetical protein
VTRLIFIIGVFSLLRIKFALLRDHNRRFHLLKLVSSDFHLNFKSFDPSIKFIHLVSLKHEKNHYVCNCNQVLFMRLADTLLLNYQKYLQQILKFSIDFLLEFLIFYLFPIMKTYNSFVVLIRPVIGKNLE